LVARIAGGLWLISIAGGLYAELSVRGDAAATAAGIMAAEPLYARGRRRESFSLCAVRLVFGQIGRRLTPGQSRIF
jgi:hypothetical protein